MVCILCSLELLTDMMHLYNYFLMTTCHVAISLLTSCNNAATSIMQMVELTENLSLCPTGLFVASFPTSNFSKPNFEREDLLLVLTGKDDWTNLLWSGSGGCWGERGADRKSSRDGVGLEHLLRQGKIIVEQPDYYRVRKTAPPRSTVGTEIIVRNWGIPCTPKKSILE